MDVDFPDLSWSFNAPNSDVISEIFIIDAAHDSFTEPDLDATCLCVGAEGSKSPQSKLIQNLRLPV